MEQKRAKSTAWGATVDKFLLNVWEEVDLSRKAQSIQCRKCWKMSKHFYMLRRKSPMGSLLMEVECKECHESKPKQNQG